MADLFINLFKALFNPSIFTNIRFYVLIFSALLATAIYFYIKTTVPSFGLQTIRLTQIYALLSVAFLYFTLLAGPLTYTFKFLPFRGKYLKARRALGVSAFLFALMHVRLAFFEQLGGFAGLFFLPSNYLIAITLSFTALVIVSAMAVTSFDYIIDKLTFPRWKLIHRFVYLAAIFILIHALMLGSDFQDLSGIIPQIFYVAISFLLLLEANRADAFLRRKFLNYPKRGLVLLLMVILISFGFVYFLLPHNTLVSLGLHEKHTHWFGKVDQGEDVGSGWFSKHLVHLIGGILLLGFFIYALIVQEKRKINENQRSNIP
ncbi:ferric reductase-like transmembrane domain-containing protein [Candidatus Daviesbacteria bacterium]|nr:ferric reductase-like transmembrane domain-containing protein [Candidatus Daviesbacteria bacterium]